MKQEVNSAVDFLTGILKKTTLGTTRVENFCTALCNILCSHYENHWFPSKPYKGSAYRCIRIVDGKMDAHIAKAGQQSGIQESQLLNMLPRELTMWVDPEEVSYRIGEDGSVGVIFEKPSDNQVDTGNVEIPSRNSSPASLVSRTPSPVAPSPVGPSPVASPSPVFWHEQIMQQQQQHQQLQQQHQQQQHHQQQQMRLQQQLHQQYQQSQDFFPRYQQQHLLNQQRHYESETCRENSRSWFPGQRTQSPVGSHGLSNWEYLATYVAS